MIRLIYASSLDSDAHYAIKTSNFTSFFYLEKNKQKLAFLGKTDLGTIPLKSSVKSIPIEDFSVLAKKIKFKTSDRNKLAFVIFKKYNLFGKKVEVPARFPLDMADFLRKYGAKLAPTYPFFPERARKSKEEVKYIKESLAHTRLAFRIIENVLRNSKIRGNRIYYKNKILTSEFLKQEAEKALIEKGMFDLLGMIISTGKQTAIPHHDGTGPILPHQPIVCDIFPRHRKSGFYADMTRTYVKGKPDLKLEKMYAAVLKAQKTAIQKIHAGISAAEVYQAAADSILKSGFDVPGYEGLAPHQSKIQNLDYLQSKGEAASLSNHRNLKNVSGISAGFTHGLGHGVGLDIHEAPSLKAASKDILEAGNIITVEPGLYYSNIGGVRIEDMVLVTKKGCQNLTNYPKYLNIL